MIRLNGRRFDRAFSVLVGDVHCPPVIANIPALCVLVSCLITFTEPLFLHPFLACSRGMHQTSAPYSILGSATLIYNLLAYFGVMPQPVLTIHLICDIHLVPLLITYTCC